MFIGFFIGQCFPSFHIQDPAINSLRRKIRQGLEADNPSLIALWLSMEEVEFNDQHELRWPLYLAQYKLLLDTFADDLIVKHWRITCLNNICKPLSHLQHELRVTSLYFQYALS
ncbi:MAG: hypothetical protein MJK13_05600 [Pseudomonadales bacterium]|nr:hypothetical protein [Pseudomonadales bacterium]